ncbi:MAG TPA: folylpolyglutamate synthase/dihydrofolate synthase family protein [Terriglobales bacterium]|nr:folylpolyglutamate synthase/dihydrofolate synthase family protein [Terriglobales bacterium]
MTYESVVSALYELGHELAHTPSHKFDLAHMRVLLEALGNPQNSFKSVLIAGTNGKGSTAATLASILRTAGHNTGLYTSPHLVRVNERIRVDGTEISDPDFATVYGKVEAKCQALIANSALPWHPSFFEMLTAMAFLHFASAGVEIAVLEVGMGGRLDATNVVEPVVSVISDIDLDHQKFLGNTIAEIAAEKAGIIHEGGLLVTLPQHPQANDVIGRTAMERHARAISASQYVPSMTPAADWGAKNRYPLRVMGNDIEVDSPLVGRHQMRNIALAITAAEQLNLAGVRLSASDVERGIRETKWPGRFQVIAAAEGYPEMVLDVAHNPAGAWALRSALSDRYEGRKITLLFGVLRDKAVHDITQILFPIADHVVATEVDNPRTASVAEMVEAAARTGTEAVPATSVRDGIEKARELAEKDGVIVVTGSIYLVGAALRCISVKVSDGTC